MAAMIDIEVRHGETFVSDTYTFNDENGDPVDLSAATAVMKIRPLEDETSAEELSLTDGAGITLGGPLGTVSYTIGNSDLNDIPAGRYFYDLFLNDLDHDGLSVCLLSGRVLVLNKVST